jgi:3',5'-cyclic AMP phosphodiesterase CpdA
LIDEAITVASGKLKVVKVGKVVKLYFNNTQIGTDITIQSFAIRYGKNHCLFATDVSTKFKNFATTNLTSNALTTFLWGSDTHVGNTDSGIITNAQYAAAFSKMDDADDADFLMLTGDTLNDGYTGNPLLATQLASYKKLSSVFTKPLYNLRGNHDIGVEEFPKHYVIEKNGVRIIYFWAEFVIVSEGVSTGDVTAEELAWIESELQKPATHKILACHFSIVTNDATNFIWPITDDHGRLQVLALAEEYGVKVYMNGHEHMPSLPIGTAGVLTDIQSASICSATQGAFNVCTVYTDKIVIDAYRDISPFTYITSKEIALV